MEVLENWWDVTKVIQTRERIPDRWPQIYGSLQGKQQEYSRAREKINKVSNQSLAKTSKRW